jgi:hypothetical protein
MVFVSVLVVGLLPYCALVLRPSLFQARRHQLIAVTRCVCGVIAAISFVNPMLAATAAGCMRSLYQRPLASIVWGFLLVPAAQQLPMPHQVAASAFHIMHGFTMMYHMQAAAGEARPVQLLASCCGYEAVACCVVGMLDARLRRRFVAAHAAARSHLHQE